MEKVKELPLKGMRLISSTIDACMAFYFFMLTPVLVDWRFNIWPVITLAALLGYGCFLVISLAAGSVKGCWAQVMAEFGGYIASAVTCYFIVECLIALMGYGPIIVVCSGYESSVFKVGEKLIYTFQAWTLAASAMTGLCLSHIQIKRALKDDASAPVFWLPAHMWIMVILGFCAGAFHGGFRVPEEIQAAIFLRGPLQEQPACTVINP